MSRASRGGLALLAVAALLGGLASCAKKAVYGEATPQIESTRGQDVVIALPSDPTSGHEWRIGAAPDSRVIALLNSGYESGQQRWIYRAVGPGTTTLRVDYGRPWTTPVKSATFTVVVR